MPRVSEQGLEPYTLTYYRDTLGAVFQAALGADLSLDTETPQGQLIDGLAIRFAELDEVIVAISNGFAPSRASGVALDDLAATLFLERFPPTRSTVTATLSGTATTVIPPDSRVSTAAGDTFRTTASATIGAGGSVDVAMESVDTGPIPAAIGALSQIVDVIAGWTTATNAAAAVVGRDSETDAELRLRYSQALRVNAQSSVGAIEGALRALTDVRDVIVRSNPTTAAITTQGQSIAAGATLSAVQGGTAAEIAQTIADAKPAGAPTSGTSAITVPILDAGGIQVDSIVINYLPATEVPITVSFSLALTPAFPADGVSQILEGMTDYVSSLSISDPVDTTRLTAAAVVVPGHQISSLSVSKKSGTGDITQRANVGLGERLTLDAADITITIA